MSRADRADGRGGRRHVLSGLLGGLYLSLLPRARALAPGAAAKAGPKPPPAFRFADGASATAWLPFEMPDARRIILAGRINGAPARFVLDSGVGSLVLNRAFAQTLNVRAVGSVTGVGVAGRVEGETGEGVRLAFDNLTLEAPDPTIIDLAPVAAAIGEADVAILGRDAFDALAVDLDFEAQRVAFRDPASQPGLTDAQHLLLARAPSGRRRVSVAIDGRPLVHASLDLGAARALVVSPDYAAQQRLLEGRKASTTLSLGVAGPVTSAIAVVDELAVGPLVFRDVPVEVPPTWELDCPVILGFPVLRRLRMLIDFPHDRVLARRIESLRAVPFRKDRSGIGARRLADRLLVVHVARGSPAEAQGLRVGDEIVAIDGTPLGPEYFRQHPSDGTKPAGTVLRLTLGRGATITLTLADYY